MTGVLDPLCGKASYEGHDGWDIRLRSLNDIGSATVLSVADGTVLRVRDGVPDRIYDRFQDGDLLGGKECGNGVVVEHVNRFVSQYCHLKQGSVAVRPGCASQGRAPGIDRRVGSGGISARPSIGPTRRCDD